MTVSVTARLALTVVFAFLAACASAQAPPDQPAGTTADPDADVPQPELGAVRECLLQVKDSTRQHAVSVLLSLDGAGAVTEAHVERIKIRDPALEACVAAAARPWRFGKLHGAKLRMSIGLDPGRDHAELSTSRCGGAMCPSLAAWMGCARNVRHADLTVRALIDPTGAPVAAAAVRADIDVSDRPRVTACFIHQQLECRCPPDADGAYLLIQNRFTADRG